MAKRGRMAFVRSACRLTFSPRPIMAIVNINVVALEMPSITRGETVI